MQYSIIKVTVILLIIFKISGIYSSVSQNVAARMRYLANTVDSERSLTDEDYANVIDKLDELDKILNVSHGKRDAHVNVAREAGESNLTVAKELRQRFKNKTTVLVEENNKTAEFRKEFSKVKEEMNTMRQHVEKKHNTQVELLNTRFDETIEIIKTGIKNITDEQLNWHPGNNLSFHKRQEFNDMVVQMKEQLQSVFEQSCKEQKMDHLEINTNELENTDTLVTKPSVQLEHGNLYKSCAHAKMAGNLRNGVYKLKNGLKVFCDQTTDGGGWTVFQRRHNGEVDFYRNWTEYKNGFGDLNGEFWLGNKYLNNFTGLGDHGLRIDMESFCGNKAYAKYQQFKMSSEEDKYRLEIGGYSGNAGDSLEYQNEMAFTTFDDDNDNDRYMNCATEHHGAWWYNHCRYSNLNGQYSDNKPHNIFTGIQWYHWKRWRSLKSTEMKFR